MKPLTEVIEEYEAAQDPLLDNLYRSFIYRGQDRGYPWIGGTNAQQAWYVAMREDGTSHNLAEMFTLQRAPQVRTDSTFMQGHCNGNQFEKEPWLGDFYKAQATAAGVDVTGAVYKSGLARYPGDPEAWVRGRGDVERLCEQRGWGCQGDVNVKPRTDAPPQADVDVADDIVEQRVLQKLDENPDLEARCLADPEKLREVSAEAKEEIKPHWAA